MDGLPNTLLKQPEEALYFPIQSSWSHAKGYLDLLEIDRIHHDYVLFESMSFCVDVGQNSNRRQRTKLIQDAFRSRLPSGNKRVYISRGNTGISRTLSNEMELIAALEGIGFVIVPVTATFEEIIAACAGADVTLSVEGSNMAHVFFVANPDAFHVAINPSDRFNNVFVDYMPSFGARFGTVVAERDGEGYRVNVTQLLELLAKNIDIKS